ncbi:MAG: carbonic anhydrase [Deltaproteobacteria bacterium]|nr:carbonic anhydrase [Deltaproteobacteria bacterium]
MISAQAALERLQAGNRRFVAGTPSHDAQIHHSRRSEIEERQQPFAIILGCSDSRVPAELVFDQGLGDLFVIRVAGNIVAPSQLGSIEFAAEQFGSRLVVVLGHSLCGAISATLEYLHRPIEIPSPNLRSIVERIRLPVEKLLSTEIQNDPDALAQQAVRANVVNSVNQLRHGSEVLERLIRDEGLRIVGSEYSLEAGVVEFFDDARAA